MISEEKDGSKLPDGLVYLYMFIAWSLLDVVTPNRVLRSAGILATGIGGYLMLSHPKINPFLYGAILLVLVGLWVNLDRVWGVLRHVL